MHILFTQIKDLNVFPYSTWEGRRDGGLEFKYDLKYEGQAAAAGPTLFPTWG